MKKFDLTHGMLGIYKTRANKAHRPEVTTEFLEREAFKMYYTGTPEERTQAWRTMVDLWKSKHKVPNTSEETVDLHGLFATN